MDGKSFEHIVTLIETSLAEKGNVTVQHNVSIIDKDGIERQIDVLIECDLGSRLGKEIIIVECKDCNTKKIELTHVDSFISLVESVSAIKGIYVSKIGFQSGAITKANNHPKILLRTLAKINEKEIFFLQVLVKMFLYFYHNG